MDSRFKYQRKFLIFDQEDSGFGTGTKPSGHVKIEVKEGKGKVFCQVANLAEDSERIEYKLYLLKSDESGVIPVLAGKIPLQRNKGELGWSFDPYDVGRTGIPFDRFNVAAVLANYRDRQNDSVMCPLAAYKDNKVEWRNKLSKLLKDEKFRDNEKFDKETVNQKPKDDDIISKDEGVVTESNYGRKENTESIKIDENEQKNETVSEIEEEKKKKELSHIEESTVIESNKNESEQDVQLESEQVMEFDEEDEKNDNKKDGGTENKIKSKSYSSYEGSKLFDMYVDDNKDNANDNKENVNQNTNCMNCIFFNQQGEKPDIQELSFEELAKRFDMTFERHSPFIVKRTDYNWWKVVSPVHLNNILYQAGIKIPVLFNPLVLMAHYKYRHLIVGIYKDDKRNREYIVCGIPGVYWVDEKPFGNACRWAQVEGNAATYGAFGYWLVFINPKTGKILSVDK